MAAFGACAELGENGVIAAVLGVDEALQVKLICCIHSCPPFGAPAFTLVCCVIDSPVTTGESQREKEADAAIVS
jgi:hypothetical protein